MKKLRGLTIIVALLALLSFSCATAPSAGSSSAAAQPGQEVKIAILHMNDVHGHVLAYSDHNVNDIAGLAAITTLVGQTRAEYENTLVVDAGDFDTGMPESDFFKGEPMIVGFNLMGLDVDILGNHEFDNDNSVLAKQLELAEYPIISANVYSKKTGKLLADGAYITKTYQGVKVGIFGLTTDETITIGTPAYVKDVEFRDEVKCAQDTVKILKEKEKCDVVIAVTHLGLYEGTESGSRRIAAKVPGIDLIIDGHSHTKLDAPVMQKNETTGKDVPIVQSWQWGLYVGKGILTIKDKKVVGFDWTPVTINDKKAVKNADGTTTITPVGPQFEENPIARQTLIEYQYKVNQILSSPIGCVATQAFLNTDKAARKAETPLGDLVADAFKWTFRDQNPDFGFVCGGTIRTDLPAKDLTMKDVYAVLPFDNTMYLVTLKGSEVQAMFDYFVTIKQGNGAFPQVSDGVKFTLNYDTKKCENITINGKPIEAGKDYVIATDSYHATGGDGYLMLKNASKAFDSSIWMRDTFVEYLKTLKTITPAEGNRFTVVGSNPL